MSRLYWLSLLIFCGFSPSLSTDVTLDIGNCGKRDDIKIVPLYMLGVKVVHINFARKDINKVIHGNDILWSGSKGSEVCSYLNSLDIYGYMFVILVILDRETSETTSFYFYVEGNELNKISKESFEQSWIDASEKHKRRVRMDEARMMAYSLRGNVSQSGSDTEDESASSAVDGQLSRGESHPLREEGDHDKAESNNILEMEECGCSMAPDDIIKHFKLIGPVKPEMGAIIIC